MGNDFVQMQNTNALEVAKMLSDELGHYRRRVATTTAGFTTLCVVISGSILNASTRLPVFASTILVVVICGVAFYSAELLRSTRRRGAYCRDPRQELIRSLEFPPDEEDIGDKRVVEFSLLSRGEPTKQESTKKHSTSVISLSWLIIALVALLAIAVIVSRTDI